MRKIELVKCRPQHRPNVSGIGARHRLAAQQTPARNVVAITRQEPALEVDASLVPLHSANGALDGGLRRRSFSFTVSPSRSNNAPIVLVAGHSICAVSRSSHARTFAGPSLDAHATIASAIVCG